MHDDPRSAGSDPSDLTQRHTIDPNASDAPEPIDPVTPATSAGPVDPLYGDASSSDPLAGPDRAGDHYTPAPEPRTEWTRSWNEAAPVTPERWYEPAPAPVPTMPAGAGRGSRRGGAGSIVGAALLSAVLASGGTVLALSAAGALDRTVATAPTIVPGATNVGVVQPVSIDESSATIAVAAMVSPAVVRITVTGTSNAGDLGVIPATGVGSGFIFDSNGWILTNNHVVQGGEKFDVELKDGRVLQGKVYGIDTLTDLAIVKVEETGLPTAAIGESDALKVGQLVVAIGSPLGTYSNSVTSGIVSAKGRSITTDGNQPLTNLIQTDAAINPGNSGGPLLDASGSVIGINTAIATNSNGIGFAIPIDIARPIMAQAIAGDQLSRPYLGIRYVSITRQLADQENLPVRVGALVDGGIDGNGQPVSGVESGTPAAKGGVKDGDIIVSVNDKIIDEEHPLDATLAQFSPGDVVNVVVLRDGKPETLQVTLGTRPSRP
ncbi:MAG: trypsin-like peptidase domain-containing protein [Chloroflexi bacterium]|nr:trypsin-like peptidase domain-containing protein [Chloroflexota bacterium]